ncbi:MAG: D-alanyl-D-alanine carboxypeptidase family protein [Acidobacteriota bacterium]|nr:MAG: D-alanyl-D-alanine carboxypeptidase family protein [Acidobacteriota bacterium]
MENDDDPLDLSGGCTLDGMPVPCGFGWRTAQAGASVAFSGSTQTSFWHDGRYYYLGVGVHGNIRYEPQGSREGFGAGTYIGAHRGVRLVQQQGARLNPCANQILTYLPDLRDASNDVPIVRYLNSSVSNDFQTAINEINNQLTEGRRNNLDLPAAIGFTEVFRTTARQQELWNARQSRIRRGLPPGNPVARPGSSRHESGFAFDVTGIVRRNVQGIEIEAYLDGSRYARYRGTNAYVLTDLGQIVVPIFDRFGFNWLGHQQIDPPHFEADPTQHGYRTRADAIRAAQDYYGNCIERGR